MIQPNWRQSKQSASQRANKPTNDQRTKNSPAEQNANTQHFIK